MTNANQHFGSGNGTENLYCHPLTAFVYTDGIKQLVEQCKAYWLIDLVISHQFSKKIHAESFQVWKLERMTGQAFQIIATDGNRKQLAQQQIHFSDFPYDQVTLWLVEETILLPNEY